MNVEEFKEELKEFYKEIETKETDRGIEFEIKTNKDNVFKGTYSYVGVGSVKVRTDGTTIHAVLPQRIEALKEIIKRFDE